MKKHNVLCAVNVNDFDQEIVEIAAEFAKQFDVDLDILHVTLSPDPINSAWPAYVGAPNELVFDNRRLRKIETKVEGVKINRHQLIGYPVNKVIEFVERNKPQLLVLGTQATSGASQLLSSVSAKIMRRVSCPVMLTKHAQSARVNHSTNTTEESVSSLKGVAE